MTNLKRSTRDRAALIGLAALLAALIGYPLVELVRAALDQGWGAFFDALTGRGTPGAVWNTVWTGTAVTVISLVGGAGAALITERSPVGRRRWLRMGMLLPSPPDSRLAGEECQASVANVATWAVAACQRAGLGPDPIR